MRVDSARTVALLVAAVGLSSSTLAAQSDADASAELSADTVGMAEVFGLRVRVPVPAGSAVFFPDTLASSADLESYAPVEWRAERAAGDGAVIILTYPLIPFGSGNISVPGLEVVVGPAELAAEGERVPGGSRVGAWADAPRGTVASIHRARVSDRTIRVHPVQSSEDILAGVSPRGPNDVVGPSWSWPAVTLLALFSSTLVGAGVTTTREWLARRTRPTATHVGQPFTLEAARLAALAELETLIATGPHAGDRVPAVYQASSGIVRGYAERLDPDWGPDLTSSELMGRLRGGAGASDALVEAMATAEAVKFGRLRPGGAATESHLRTLRAWLSRESGA
jgi:hypothetical protein